MAGDWVQMRVSLQRDPKVICMADFLAEERQFMDWLTDPVRRTCDSNAYEHVTRNVVTALCVTGLLVTWGTAREQGERDGDDLVVNFCDFIAIDAIAGVPKFGEALGFVEWAEEQEDGSLRFPKFFQRKRSPAERMDATNAERQARHRKKVKGTDSAEVTGDVTPLRNVTVTRQSRVESLVGRQVGRKTESSKKQLDCLQRVETKHLSCAADLCGFHRVANSESPEKIPADEATLLCLFGAAVRALERPEKRLEMFCGIVRHQKWDAITGDQRAKARAKLKEHRAWIADARSRGERIPESAIPLPDEEKP